MAGTQNSDHKLKPIPGIETDLSAGDALGPTMQEQEHGQPTMTPLQATHSYFLGVAEDPIRTIPLLRIPTAPFAPLAPQSQPFHRAPRPPFVRRHASPTHVPVRADYFGPISPENVPFPTTGYAASDAPLASQPAQPRLQPQSFLRSQAGKADLALTGADDDMGLGVHIIFELPPPQYPIQETARRGAGRTRPSQARGAIQRRTMRDLNHRLVTSTDCRYPYTSVASNASICDRALNRRSSASRRPRFAFEKGINAVADFRLNQLVDYKFSDQSKAPHEILRQRVAFQIRSRIVEASLLNGANTCEALQDVTANGDLPTFSERYFGVQSDRSAKSVSNPTICPPQYRSKSNPFPELEALPVLRKVHWAPLPARTCGTFSYHGQRIFRMPIPPPTRDFHPGYTEIAANIAASEEEEDFGRVDDEREEWVTVVTEDAEENGRLEKENDDLQ